MAISKWNYTFSLILKLERISKRLNMTKLGLAITAGPLLFWNYFSKALKARSIAGLNGFLRQTGKEPTTYQEVQWANKSSCTYIQYTYVQVCGISAHSGAFLAVFKNFGRIVGISMAFFTKPSIRSMGKQKLMYENCRYILDICRIPICAQWSIFFYFRAVWHYCSIHCFFLTND